MKFTKADLEGVGYAIDILEDQMANGSEDPSTETNLHRLKRLLKKLKQANKE